MSPQLLQGSHKSLKLGSKFNSLF